MPVVLLSLPSTSSLRISCGDKPPKVPVRQSIVKQLRVLLERYTAPTPGMPIVRLIVGDDNLSTDEARQALQREMDVDPLWEVIPTYAGWGGDHVAVNGATATFIPIAVGRHFENRGMRPDQHDALGLELSVAGASQPAKEALPSRWWCFSACRPRRRCESPYGLWHQPS